MPNKDEEDNVILRIVWAYFAKLIPKEKMIDYLDRLDHTFKHLHEQEKKEKAKEFLEGKKFQNF